MFRHERPQKGRLRQFHQINAEYIGTPSPYADAELIYLLIQILDRLADSGLHPAEASRCGGKAAGVGDGNQGAQMVEGKAVEHISVNMMDNANIMPILVMIEKSHHLPIEHALTFEGVPS